jgi:hypothetical protein
MAGEEPWSRELEVRIAECDIALMGTKTVDDIEPKAVMTADELARWDQLPADEQLARLRAAIRRGIESGPSDMTVDQIWAKIRARHPDAGL